MDTNTPTSPSSPNALAVVPVQESAYAKMKKIISSPRGKRRASTAPPAKVFGVGLEEILSRDGSEIGVPSIVQKMCEFILKNGLLVEGIFRVNANMKTVEKLKTAIDKYGDVDLEETNDVMAVASLLKMFLRELPDSVVPYEMQPGFIKAQSLREEKVQHLMTLKFLIQKMPDVNFYLLKYLINFLNKIVDNSDSNKMTGVALAVVFGPNIFRCSDTLQGLQDQACVNAITCKLIEQYEYLFSTDGKDSEGNNKDQTDAGSLSDRSPRIKPARPPPPKFSQSVQLPSKMRSDENSNTVEGSNANKYLSKSLDDSLTGSQIKVPRIETNGGPPVNEHQGRKKYNRSVTINTELSRSLSPQKAPRPSSGLPIASPSSKQIVDTTIRDSVKEHLFGMGLVTSSSESDNQGLETMNSPEDGPAAGETQQPIRDVLKRFTAEKLSGATFKPSDVRKLSPKTRKNENMPEATKTIRSNQRPLSFPTNEIAGTVSADSLAMMKDQWTGTLTSLTLHRAPPPRTRRQRRRLTNTRSENVEELLRNQNNELINDNELGNEEPNATKTNQSNTTWPPNPLTKNAQKIIDNPLLVKIRNDKYSKPRSSSDESSGTNQASILVQQEIGKGNSRDRTASPRKTVAKIAAKKIEAASGMTEIDAKSEENESADKPVIPPLDLYRVHQDDFEETETRFSPKERFSHVLADSPIRSPRYFPSGGDERMHNAHKEQIFLEKKQDTVPILDMSAKDLKKRIESLRKIITNFETSFEAEHHRMPKASEKAQVQKYVAELGRARKQLREVLSSIKENPDRADSTQTGSEIGFAPNLRDIISKDSQPTKEDTLHLLLKKLQDKRGAAGRPEEIEVMSTDQLKDEKLAVQKALLQFENLHGRPITKDDKALMRPIYERYRRIKRMIATGKEPSSTKGKDTSDGNLARLRESVDMSSSKDLKFTAEGMPLHETAENSNVNKGGNVDASKYDDLNDTFNITRKPEDLQTSKTNADVGTVIISSLSQRSSGQTMSEAVLHDATLEELVQQQKMAKRSKKTLGKTLKDYEDEFFAENGRKVSKEDRGPFETEYSEYKLIKARLRLLEALITKKKVNQTV